MWVASGKGYPEPSRLGKKGRCLDTCPTSYVTAESNAFIQEYQVWKLFGGVSVLALPARNVEAFCILENEMRAEIKRDEQQTT